VVTAGPQRIHHRAVTPRCGTTRARGFGRRHRQYQRRSASAADATAGSLRRSCSRTRTDLWLRNSAVTPQARLELEETVVVAPFDTRARRTQNLKS
jgi:hypothetical protein